MRKIGKILSVLVRIGFSKVGFKSGQSQPGSTTVYKALNLEKLEKRAKISFQDSQTEGKRKEKKRKRGKKSMINMRPFME